MRTIYALVNRFFSLSEAEKALTKSPDYRSRTAMGKSFGAVKIFALVALAVLLETGCSFPSKHLSPPASSPYRAPWIDARAVVDLTYPLGPTTIFWPTSLPFTLEPVSQGWTEGGYWYAAHNIHMAEHGGTHMDAPFHFGKGKATTDAVPLSSCMGPAAVVDVRDKAAANPDYALSIEDLLRWEREHGPLPRGAIVVMYSGWGRRWGDKRAYLGSDVPGDVGNLHFPGFSEQAARFLVQQREIAAIAVDTASIDPGPSRDFPVHRILAEGNKPAFENLAGVERLPPAGAFIVALPIKIVGGSGGPARVIAFLPGGP